MTATFTLQVVRITAPTRLDRAVLMRDLPARFYLHSQDCVVDMSHTRSMDSTGIGWLTRLYRNQRSAGRKLVLLAPAKAVRKALRALIDDLLQRGLDRLFTVADNEVQAAQLLANSQ